MENTATSPASVSTSNSKPATRSRRGCYTCRGRKVKCDEVKPVCGHCNRLQLACSWTPPAARSRRDHVKSAPRTSDLPSILQDNNSMDDSSHSQQIQPKNSVLNVPVDLHLAPSVGQPRAQDAGFAAQGFYNGVNLDAWDFDLLEDDSLWVGLPFVQPPAQIIQPTNQLTQSTITTQPTAAETSRPNAGQSVPGFVTPGGSDVPTSEIVLLRHFVDFAVIPILVNVEPRWNSARISILRIAKSSPALRHAICAFSALSLGEQDQKSSDNNQSSTYYFNMGLTELNSFMNNPALSFTPEVHEIVLASVFFLSYVELIMSSSPTHTPDLLRRAHAISKTGLESWSALGVQLRTWLKLLDAKVVSAGGDGTHLLVTPDVQDLEGFGDGLSPAADQNATPGSKALALETEDILYNSLNKLAYNFYLQVLTFSGRIAQLDRWHRPRGSVSDEFEVMLGADKVVKDLGTLWTRRPAIIDLADKGDQLRQHLSADLAAKIEQNLRTYICQFYACYIHLQRVAYHHLPSTAQAKRAFEKIVRLSRLSVSEGRTLPASMLWPLMMAGCEASEEKTRTWIIQRIEDMKSTVGNAARTAQLVAEITKRQVETDTRADARTVMESVFGHAWAII